MRDALDRRNFLRGIGAVTLVGTLAGCAGNGDQPAGTPTDTPESTEPTTTAGGTPTTAGGDIQSRVDEYLSDVSNYDGSITDRTGSDSVTVDVGAEGNGGNFAFAPPAIRVSAGTEVVWEWTGQGGQHNVVHEGGNFESDLTATAGHTFSQTFDEAGLYRYYCQPHRTLGMKGVVVVE
ncbi:MAG: halocyanin domain-containing protein [Halorientalis sp.]